MLKLGRRGSARQALQDVLDELEAAQLLSDARFADAYTASRVARGFGPLKIREELKSRGVDAATRDAVCPQSGSDWFERAVAARRKRFGEALPSALAERARQARFLAQRGYTAEQVTAALDADEGMC